MGAIVQLVVISFVVEGGDVVGLDATGAGFLKQSNCGLLLEFALREKKWGGLT